MNLNDAIAAVDNIKSGKRINKPFDWWERAERVLRESGDEYRAVLAHDAAIRAYRFEEWQADLA